MVAYATHYGCIIFSFAAEISRCLSAIISSASAAWSRNNCLASGAHAFAKLIGLPAWLDTPINKPPSRRDCSTQSGTEVSTVLCSTRMIDLYSGAWDCLPSSSLESLPLPEAAVMEDGAGVAGGGVTFTALRSMRFKWKVAMRCTTAGGWGFLPIVVTAR